MEEAAVDGGGKGLVERGTPVLHPRPPLNIANASDRFVKLGKERVEPEAGTRSLRRSLLMHAYLAYRTSGHRGSRGCSAPRMLGITKANAHSPAIIFNVVPADRLRHSPSVISAGLSR